MTLDFFHTPGSKLCLASIRRNGSLLLTKNYTVIMLMALGRWSTSIKVAIAGPWHYARYLISSMMVATKQDLCAEAFVKSKALISMNCTMWFRSLCPLRSSLLEQLHGTGICIMLTSSLPLLMQKWESKSTLTYRKCFNKNFQTKLVFWWNQWMVLSKHQGSGILWSLTCYYLWDLPRHRQITVFVKFDLKGQEDVILVLVYVDDLLIMSPS